MEPNDDDADVCDGCGESFRSSVIVVTLDDGRFLCPKCCRVKEDTEAERAWTRERAKYPRLIQAGYVCFALTLLFCPLVFGPLGTAIGGYLILNGATRHGLTITLLTVAAFAVCFVIGLMIIASRGS